MSDTQRSDDGPTGQPSRQLEPRSPADGVRDDQAKPAGSAVPGPPEPPAAVVGGGGDTMLCTGPTGTSAVRVSATTGAWVPVPDVGAAVSPAASWPVGGAGREDRRARHGGHGGHDATGAGHEMTMTAPDRSQRKMSSSALVETDTQPAVGPPVDTCRKIALPLPGVAPSL